MCGTREALGDWRALLGSWPGRGGGAGPGARRRGRLPYPTAPAALHPLVLPGLPAAPHPGPRGPLRAHPGSACAPAFSSSPRRRDQPCLSHGRPRERRVAVSLGEAPCRALRRVLRVLRGVACDSRVPGRVRAICLLLFPGQHPWYPPLCSGGCWYLQRPFTSRS